MRHWVSFKGASKPWRSPAEAASYDFLTATVVSLPLQEARLCGMLRRELHAWECTHAVLRGRGDGDIISRADYLKDYETP
jgi:hypothetical protein